MSGISVVIPCFGGVEDTRACLGALRGQVGVPPMEVVVVDNASPDETGRLGDEWPEVRVVASATNLGFAGGVNLGCAAARYETLLILNNDTMAAPRMVQRMLRVMESEANVGAVAPTSNHVKGPARVEVGDLGATEAGRAELEELLAETSKGRAVQDVETLSGLCLLVPRRVVEAVDGFDERYGPGMFEDDDFCLKVRLRGERLVIARDAFLHHRGHRTFRRMGADVADTMNERRATFRAKWEGDCAGRTYLGRLDGRHDVAVSAARTALAKAPGWPDAHVVLADEALLRGDDAALLEHAERFLAVSPAHGPMRLKRAMGLLGTGADAEGREAIREALSSCHFGHDELDTLLTQVGQFAAQRGMYELAIAQLQPVLDGEGAPVAARAALGVALLGLDRVAEAAQHFEAAAAAGDSAARNNLGICRWRLGELATAVAEFERAVAAAPGDAAFADNLRQARSACAAGSGAGRGH